MVEFCDLGLPVSLQRTGASLLWFPRKSTGASPTLSFVMHTTSFNRSCRQGPLVPGVITHNKSSATWFERDPGANSRIHVAGSGMPTHMYRQTTDRCDTLLSKLEKMKCPRLLTTGMYVPRPPKGSFEASVLMQASLTRRSPNTWRHNNSP